MRMKEEIFLLYNYISYLNVHYQERGNKKGEDYGMRNAMFWEITGSRPRTS